MTEKLLFSGKSHVTSGPEGVARSSDGRFVLDVAEPHPAAEQLFGSAWSACYMGALELAAQRRKVTLPTPPAVDAEINLFLGDSGFFLRARLAVSVPGVDREVAQQLIEAAHGICPYSKATRGNIEVVTTLV
jgi:Ohr subfamily peroxiredoxin